MTLASNFASYIQQITIEAALESSDATSYGNIWKDMTESHSLQIVINRSYRGKHRY